MAAPEAASSIAAIVSAAGGAFAAWAAWRSARAAERSAESARSAGRLSLARELASVTALVTDESRRCDSLCNDLIRAYQELSAHSNSQTPLAYIPDVEKQRDTAQRLSAEAVPIAQHAVSLHEATEERLSQELVRMSAAIVEARALREGLESRVASVASQNSAYREAVIRRTRG